MPMYAPLSLIPVKSLYRFLQPYKIPEASSFEGGHEVRHTHIYCFDLCQHRRRLSQGKSLKMAARVMSCQCLILTCQLNLKARIKLAVYSIDALFAKKHTAVCKSETDTSNRTFRIRFFAHSRIVPGRVIVNSTSKNTGGENTRRLVKRMQSDYATRGSL